MIVRWQFIKRRHSLGGHGNLRVTNIPGQKVGGDEQEHVECQEDHRELGGQKWQTILIDEQNAKENELQTLQRRATGTDERWANRENRNDQQVAEQKDRDQMHIA